MSMVDNMERMIDSLENGEASAAYKMEAERVRACPDCGRSDCASLSDPPHMCIRSPEAREAYDEWRRGALVDLDCEHPDVDEMTCLVCGEWVGPAADPDYYERSNP